MVVAKDHRRRRTTAKEYKCKACDASFQSKHKLLGHIHCAHEETKCPFCDETRMSFTSLRQHAAVKHARKFDEKNWRNMKTMKKMQETPGYKIRCLS